MKVDSLATFDIVDEVVWRAESLANLDAAGDAV